MTVGTPSFFPCLEAVLLSETKKENLELWVLGHLLKSGLPGGESLSVTQSVSKRLLSFSQLVPNFLRPLGLDWADALG